NGPPPRRDERACPLRPATETQRRRRTIFNSTLRAAVLWANFRVPHSASVAMDTGASLAPSNSPKLLTNIGKRYRLHNTSNPYATARCYTDRTNGCHIPNLRWKYRLAF